MPLAFVREGEKVDASQKTCLKHALTIHKGLSDVREKTSAE
jgi:hypothetical protein